jgi:cytolysin-activating lysine-acyltransferase
MNTDTTPNSSAGQAPTVSHFLGEMTWLLSQSPLHKALPISALEWLVMPALIHRQFYLFRDGDKPIGLALWAKCSPAVVAKLNKGLLEPGNELSLQDWQSGEDVWLVDLIAPFASADNKQRELMFADLISGPLKGTAFSFHLTDPATGKRSVKRVEANAGDQLKDALESALGGS